MTIDFWPRKPPKRKMPKLPILAGKAQQKLSQAILCGDHELASWIDGAVKQKLVTGDLQAVQELRDRLDDVMAPL